MRTIAACSASRSSGLAVTAASAAISPSTSLRALSNSKGPGPLSPAIAAAGGPAVTNMPAPTRTSTSPPISSEMIASRTDVRETPSKHGQLALRGQTRTRARTRRSRSARRSGRRSGDRAAAARRPAAARRLPLDAPGGFPARLPFCALRPRSNAVRLRRRIYSMVDPRLQSGQVVQPPVHGRHRAAGSAACSPVKRTPP